MEPLADPGLLAAVALVIAGSVQTLMSVVASDHPYRMTSYAYDGVANGCDSPWVEPSIVVALVTAELQRATHAMGEFRSLHASVVAQTQRLNRS